MESRKELAAEKKRCGSHNCTQSVLCTYCDLTGLDEETIKHAGNCFAAGMGNGEGTCGSIVGAGIVYGLAVRDQAKAVKGMRQIMEKFQERNGATLPYVRQRNSLYYWTTKEVRPSLPR